MKQIVVMLKNIGSVSVERSRAVGIHRPEKLAARDAVEAYARIQQYSFKLSLNLCYAREGALRDLHWTALPVKVKQKLRVAARRASNA